MGTAEVGTGAAADAGAVDCLGVVAVAGADVGAAAGAVGCVGEDAAMGVV